MAVDIQSQMLYCYQTAILWQKKVFQKGGKKVRIAYSTEYSQAVTHPSTNSAQSCLTAVIRQELVCSTWYGCRHLKCVEKLFLTYDKYANQG